MRMRLLLSACPTAAVSAAAAAAAAIAYAASLTLYSKPMRDRRRPTSMCTGAASSSDRPKTWVWVRVLGEGAMGQKLADRVLLLHRL
jgi:hypothetical protein